jgi:outer membrane lipoprotein-sorting protein
MKNKNFLLYKLLVVLFSFYAAGFFSASAAAYVLPGTHILELMATKSRKAKTLLVSQKLVIHDNDTNEDSVEFNETLRYIFPGSFRSDVESENTKRIHVMSKGSAVTVIGDQIYEPAETRFDRYKDVILFHSRVLLNEKLTLLGLDVTITSLGRFEDKIAYVMGAQYPDKSSSQIWFDRVTFRPIRWLLVSDTPQGIKDILEVRYLNWQAVRGIWYPMRIKFYEQERLVREIRVDHIKVNPTFSKKLFDIEHIKSIYPSAAVVSPRQEEKGGISEIQKTIEEFKKMYE